MHDDVVGTRNLGCKLATTDGTRLYYTCTWDFAAPSVTPTWMRTLSVFDPATGVERDLYCFQRAWADDSCEPHTGTGLAASAAGPAISMSLRWCPELNVYFYDVAKDALINVSQQPGGAVEPHMDGPYLVWSDPNPASGSADIALYDTRTGEKRYLDPHPGDQWAPRVSGELVVWADHRNDPSGSRLVSHNADIFLHDLSTGETRAVIVHPAKQTEPDVDGEWVVWEDYRHNPGDPAPGGFGTTQDIFAKNLRTGKITQLTATGGGYKSEPRVDRGRVFYTMLDARNEPSVFMIDLAKRLGPDGGPGDGGAGGGGSVDGRSADSGSP